MVRWLDYAADVGPDEAPPRRGPSAARCPRRTRSSSGTAAGTGASGASPTTDGEPFWSADQGHVATAYLHHSAALAARIGRLLGHDDEAAALDELAAGALDAWRAEYLDDDGSLAPGHAGQPRARPGLRPRARRAPRPRPPTGWSS